MCFLVFAKTRFAYKVQRELSIKILTSYTNRNYTFFLNYSSAECLRDIGTDVSGVTTMISHGFSLLSELLTIFMIFIYIFLTNYKFSFLVAIIAGFCLFLVLKLFRNLCRNLGEKSRKYGELIYKYSLELFRGIKEIKVLGRQKFFIDNYENVTIKQNKVASEYAVSLASPAYIIEALCVTGLLVCLCLSNNLSNNENMVSMIPQLATFAMAAFRILPSLGKISSSINNIIYAVPMVNATYHHITEIKNADARKEEVNAKDQEVNFIDEIAINNVSWHYPNSEKNVLENLSLKIKKGTSVAFIGTSGAGKTTLADIILGLLIPQSGSVMMDGKDIYQLGMGWKNLIGYVPQNAYLIDDKIRKNVAFGIEEKNIDNVKVWHALEQAQLKEFVEKLPQKIDTFIGETGVRFSGGQRQRLSIARALYENPQILVLDEATSALDNDTEHALIEAIEKLQKEKTMIVVAHRLTTVKNCDTIYEIRDGKAMLKDKQEIFRE